MWKYRIMQFVVLLLLIPVLACTAFASEKRKQHESADDNLMTKSGYAQVGPRPFYLISKMGDSELKERLQACTDKKIARTDFSIGHRGAALQFPEHSKESYEAAARMGAGILECDVTFTEDKELVCRHSQCDLHTTTNILETPLAAKCSKPFQPAVFDQQGNMVSPASAQCCTSDISLAEFKTLRAKMDGANAAATNIREYINGTTGFRTDLYAASATLMTHKESIELFKSLGVKMTPELKAPAVPMPFKGEYSQQAFAQQMLDEYKQSGVSPSSVFPQSFNYEDILYWIKSEPRFGQQAVFLDGRYEDPGFSYQNPGTWQPSMMQMRADGVNYLAPPMWMLLALDSADTIVPSTYAVEASAVGLKLISWTLERSGDLTDGGGWYYQSIAKQIDNSAQTYNVLDVLAQKVGIVGMFSDWPGTTSYYASCMGLK